MYTTHTPGYPHREVVHCLTASVQRTHMYAHTFYVPELLTYLHHPAGFVSAFPPPRSIYRGELTTFSVSSPRHRPNSIEKLRPASKRAQAPSLRTPYRSRHLGNRKTYPTILWQGGAHVQPSHMAACGCARSSSFSSCRCSRGPSRSKAFQQMNALISFRGSMHTVQHRV